MSQGEINVTAVSELLVGEAWLLDRERFDQWLELFTDDATYWVPLEAGQVSPLETQSIIYDDRRLMTLRVRQMHHPRAHARQPGARTVHQVSNIRVREAAAPVSATEIIVDSALVVIEYRAERQRVFGATVEHRIRATAAGLRIAAKRIDLVNSEAALDGIAFLL